MNLNTNFDLIATKTIENLAATIEDQDPEGILEIDFLGDILNITTPSGQFVVNKHSAAKEIWLASPLSGPYHFAYKTNKWLDSRDNDLFYLLERELCQFTEIKLTNEPL